MDDQEGVFRLVAVVGQDSSVPDRWKAMGLVYAAGESIFLEQIHAGAEFPSRDHALRSGISAARAIARTLDPAECRANRPARFW